MQTIAVLTSGGDSPGMNAAIRSVVRYGIHKELKVLGVKQGYEGLLNADIEEMTLSSVADIIHRGGTKLLSARSERFKTEEGQRKALNVINIFNIDGIVVIGGDGSFRGAEALSNHGIPTVGIPGTIDNDLDYTEYTIGFDTAVNTALDAISKIRDTSTSHGRANIIEVMGRDCGDLALYAGLAGGAESIIVPEVPFDLDRVCNKLLQGRNRGKLHSLIVLAEGVGNAMEIGDQIQEKTGIETRATILGHIQRGGTPSGRDRMMASQMGAKAVDLLIQGEGSMVVGIKGKEIIAVPISEALKTKTPIDEKTYELADILSK